MYDYLAAELISISQLDRWETEKDEITPYTSILSVNKQIYREAKSVFWNQLEWTCSLETLFSRDGTFTGAELVTPSFTITYLPDIPTTEFHSHTLRLINTTMAIAGTINILIRGFSISDTTKWESHISRILEPVLIPGLCQNKALAKINLMMVADLDLPREEAIQMLTEASVRVATPFQQALPNMKIEYCMPNFDFLNV